MARGKAAEFIDGNLDSVDGHNISAAAAARLPLCLCVYCKHHCCRVRREIYVYIHPYKCAEVFGTGSVCAGGCYRANFTIASPISVDLHYYSD